MSHWRKQQGQDTYFRQAKTDGYRARSAYKLLQIQEKFRIIRAGDVVVDLGAAPGSWSQAAVTLVKRHGRVIALDLQEIAPMPGVTVMQGDMTTAAVQDAVAEAAGGSVDVVLSDAAPSASGIRDRDHALSMNLAEAARMVARRLLRTGGHLIIKIFEGPDLQPFVKETRSDFKSVRVFAPAASRKESRETFLIAQHYQGKPSPEPEVQEDAFDVES